MVPAIAVAAVAGALLFWAFQPRLRRGQGGTHSIYLGRPQGLRALHLMLLHEGFSSEPYLGSLDRINFEGALWIVAPPSTMEDAAPDLRAWVERGHTLVFFSSHPSDLLAQVGIKQTPAANSDPGPAEARSSLSKKHAPFIITAGDASLSAPSAEVLYAKKDAAQVIELTCGRGRVIAVADVFAPSNEGIDAGDNVFFLLELARRSAGPKGTIGFVETIHGFAPVSGLVSYFRQVGGAPTLLQLTFIALAALFAAAVRTAPPLPASRLDRRPAAEYAAAVALLYRRAGAHTRALAAAVEELHRFLRSPTAPRFLDPASLAQAERLAGEGHDLLHRPTQKAEAVRWATRAAAFRRFPHARR